MQAGQLRHVVTIQRPAPVQDAVGQESAEYVDLYTNVRAGVYPLSGREYVAAQQVAAEVTTRILIRYQPNINAGCRVLRENEDDSPPSIETYDVIAALPDDKTGRDYINLMCVQRLAEGWRRGE